MQGGIDKYQEYPVADPTRLELQLQIPAMARRHLPDISRCLIMRRIRHEVIRVEAPTEPGLARYLVVNKALYFSAPSESGVSKEPVSYPFDRVGQEHGSDHDCGDEKRWRQTCLFAKLQYQ